uniref:amidase family protein n=1 Tax=Bilophila wadsworthia TaxID=35833 RepID=UPI00266ECF78
PAGWCGLYGIRSTQGQSDISGIYPRAASLDTVGAMARSARDIDLLLQILADPPLRDTLRVSAPIRYLRIGVFPELVRAKGSPEVIEAYAEAVGRWEEFGECIPVGLPLLDDPAVVDSVGTIRSYEFARDIRKDIEGNPFAGKMHPVPLADYKNGQQTTPEAYHAALLHKQALSRQVDAFFASLQVDFLLLPVAFSTAPSIDAPQEAFTAGRALVNLFSVAGVPTLVVPGELTAGGMPLGIQLVGPALSERLLLDAGTAYETTYGPFPTPPLASA